MLIVGYDEAGVAEYRVECPGLTDNCNSYAECSDDPCNDDDLDRQFDAGDDSPVLHGEVHHRIDGDWMRQLGQCFIATHPGLVNAARKLNVPHDGGELAAGEYRVTVDTTGNPTDLVLELAEMDNRPNRPERLCIDHSRAAVGGPKSRCPECLGTAVHVTRWAAALEEIEGGDRVPQHLLDRLQATDSAPSLPESGGAR